MLILLLITLSHAFAAVSEAEFAQNLARARSVSEIARLENEFAALKIAQAACRIQLAEKTAPVSCYEALALEGGSRLTRLRKLDRLCAAAAAALRIADTNAYVSSACAKSLSAARAIREYRAEEGSEWSSY